MTAVTPEARQPLRRGPPPLPPHPLRPRRRPPARPPPGGGRGRAAARRARAPPPDFILLAAPLAGIDPIAVGDIRDLVAHLKDRGIGVLITDHNVRETLDIVDRAY